MGTAHPTPETATPVGTAHPTPETSTVRTNASRRAKTVRVSEPRERLLATASGLFYREGIHSVGVDRILDAANVTRATFYRHFPGKEDLVQAYLEAEDASIRAMFTGARELTDDPRQLLGVMIAGLADDIEHHHTRGCPFINASAEYPDARSRVRRTVKSHRDWFRETLREALVAAGQDDAEERAGALVLLRDAALVGGYLDGPNTIRNTFVRTARDVAGL
ncbi:MAG: TetR family transcriptional regulator [Rhodoglobus sp.]|nr:TetR family transcriptional regulator [Rhodoglobus sp.]